MVPLFDCGSDNSLKPEGFDTGCKNPVCLLSSKASWDNLRKLKREVQQITNPNRMKIVLYIFNTRAHFPLRFAKEVCTFFLVGRGPSAQAQINSCVIRLPSGGCQGSDFFVSALHLIYMAAMIDPLNMEMGYRIAKVS